MQSNRKRTGSAVAVSKLPFLLGLIPPGAKASTARGKTAPRDKRLQVEPLESRFMLAHAVDGVANQIRALSGSVITPAIPSPASNASVLIAIDGSLYKQGV